jgi:hypothetical protein
VGSWLVVRRDGKNHLVGAVESINYDDVLDHHHPRVRSEDQLVVVRAELVARAGDAPMLTHPREELLSEFQAKLARDA